MLNDNEKKRIADTLRNTAETQIKTAVCLDGDGTSSIICDEKFFCHMLTAFSKYSFIDLKLEATGDNSHHIIEDTGIVLGQTIDKAVGDKFGIKRFGFAYIPMDEALTRVCIDLSSRSYLQFDYKFASYLTADFETQNTIEFFRALAFNMRATVHIDVLRGENDHHIIESIFKAFGAALKIALERDEKIKIMSTKGYI